jgi:hypothetical protein
LRETLRNYETDFGAPETSTNPVDSPPPTISTGPMLVVNGPAQGFLSGDQLDAGTIPADGPGGQSLSIPLTLENPGDAPLTIDTVQLSNGNVGFSIAGQNPAGMTLAAGQSVPLNLVFDPSVAGTAADTLTITTNDPTSPFTLTLTGEGRTTGGQLSVSLTGNNNFGGATVGGSPVAENNFVTVTNTGGGPLTETLGGTGTVVFGTGSNALDAFGGGPLTLAPGITVRGSTGVVAGDVINQGTIAADEVASAAGGSGGSAAGIQINGTFDNQGTVAAKNGATLTVSGGGLVVRGSGPVTTGPVTTGPVGSGPGTLPSGTLTGGTWEVFANSTIQFVPGTISTNAATILLDGANSNCYAGPSGSTDALGGLTTNAAAGNLTLQDGRNLTVAAGFDNAGSLTAGAGSTLIVPGDFSQESTGALTVAIAGTDPSQFGQVGISGTATLAGTLNLSLAAGYDPPLGSSYQVLGYGSHNGTFDTITGLAIGDGKVLQPSYTATGLTLTVVAG